MMNVSKNYNNIYIKEIVQQSKGVILRYAPNDNCYRFQPFSHAIASNAVEELGALMRRNLLFYCYGEDEVVSHYEKGTFPRLETAARYAYKMRLPERMATSDGLPGEVLLDLLVQLYVPCAYKMAVRPVMRQYDNNEIKGYDLTYFTVENGKYGLWLGQAKLGDKDYCKGDIKKDLLTKFNNDYLTQQVFFVCDKQVGTTPESIQLTDIINKINIATLEQDEASRQNALLHCFKDNNIDIFIPCLLAYDEDRVYQDATTIVGEIEKELDAFQQYYLKQTFSFRGFSPNIIFYIFPIASVAQLRDPNRGFYHGLR